MPLSAADRIEILDLIARYNHALEIDRDADAWVGTFTEDAVFVTGNGAGGTGTAGLRAFFRGNKTPEERRLMRHWVNNVVIDGDGDEARATCYLLLLDVSGAPRVEGTGIYKDRLRRVDGAWRFAERQISIDQYPRAI